MDERSSLGTASKRGCFFRNARARNTHVEATLNHPFAAQVAAGCFLTPNHPVRFGGAWRRAGELGAVEHRGRGVVYGLELEGHVDTVLVGDGAVVAAVGVYCGPAFGWNVFTRKSARCDRLRCAACDVCVDAALDFSKVAPADLDVEYAPYVADDDDDDDVGFVDRRPAMIAVG